MAQLDRPAAGADHDPQPIRARVVGSIPRPPDSSQRVEARGAPRLEAAEVPSITGVRLRPFGADATLLNISSTGALVECTNRLRLGTAVTLVFEGTFSPSVVAGRVARSTVATVSGNGVLRYHVGVAFQAPIALQPAEPQPASDLKVPVASTAPEPLVFVPPAPAPLVNRW